MIGGEDGIFEHASMSQIDCNARPAAFLDRDGVINVDHGYTFRLDDLVFTPTAIEGVRVLNQAGYLVLVITNQSGIARGLYGEDDVERFHNHMQEQLRRECAHIDAFYYCAYHPEGTIPAFSIDHEDRKPSPGMLHRAIRDFTIRLDGSFLIGDKESDVVAAERVGIPGIRVATNTCDLAETVRVFLTRMDGQEAC